jgi:hypothetical protein
MIYGILSPKGYILPYRAQPEPLHVPRVQAAVLLALAYYGPTTKYEIAKRARLKPGGDVDWYRGEGIDRGDRIRYPVVHNAMKVLRSYGVVREVAKKRGKKGARVLVFDLTQKGVLFLVGFISRIDWGRLAANSGGAAVRLLMLLRWWKYFESKKLDPLIRAMYSGLGREVIHYLADQGGRRPTDDEFRVVMEREVGRVAVQSWEEYVRFTIANLLDDGLAGLYMKTRRDEVEHLRITLAEAEKRFRMVDSLSHWIDQQRAAGVPDQRIESSLMQWMARGEGQPLDPGQQSLIST